jgi:ketosteroid isomerase-like protein
MNEPQQQSSEKIRELAKALDDALEKKDIELIKSFFDERCEIELLGITLEGYKGVEKWLKYIFNYVDSFRLEPINILIEDDVFFEEFVVHAKFPDKSTLQSKWAEVLIYKRYKIRSLRLYFDRVVFAKAAVSGFFAQKILQYIERKTLEGLI